MVTEYKRKSISPSKYKLKDLIGEVGDWANDVERIASNMSGAANDLVFSLDMYAPNSIRSKAAKFTNAALDISSVRSTAYSLIGEARKVEWTPSTKAVRDLINSLKKMTDYCSKVERSISLYNNSKLIADILYSDDAGSPNSLANKSSNTIFSYVEDIKTGLKQIPSIKRKAFEFATKFKDWMESYSPGRFARWIDQVFGNRLDGGKPKIQVSSGGDFVRVYVDPDDVPLASGIMDNFMADNELGARWEVVKKSFPRKSFQILGCHKCAQGPNAGMPGPCPENQAEPAKQGRKPAQQEQPQGQQQKPKSKEEIRRERANRKLEKKRTRKIEQELSEQQKITAGKIITKVAAALVKAPIKVQEAATKVYLQAKNAIEGGIEAAVPEENQEAAREFAFEAISGLLQRAAFGSTMGDVTSPTSFEQDFMANVTTWGAAKALVATCKKFPNVCNSPASPIRWLFGKVGEKEQQQEAPKSFGRWKTKGMPEGVDPKLLAKAAFKTIKSIVKDTDITLEEVYRQVVQMIKQKQSGGDQPSNETKAMSWMDNSSGGALVAEPKIGSREEETSWLGHKRIKAPRIMRRTKFNRPFEGLYTGEMGEKTNRCFSIISSHKCQHGPNAGKPGICPEDRPGANQGQKPSTEGIDSYSHMRSATPEEVAQVFKTIGKTSWEGMKKAKEWIVYLEHKVKDWVESLVNKVENWKPESKLGTVIRYSIKTAFWTMKWGTKAAFASYIGGQKVAGKIADNLGLSPEKTETLKAVLMGVDLVAVKFVPAVGMGLGLSGTAIAGATFIPIGSSLFIGAGLGWMGLKGTMAMYKKAKEMVKGALATKGIRGIQTKARRKNDPILAKRKEALKKISSIFKKEIVEVQKALRQAPFSADNISRAFESASWEFKYLADQGERNGYTKTGAGVSVTDLLDYHLGEIEDKIEFEERVGKIPKKEMDKVRAIVKKMEGSLLVAISSTSFVEAPDWRPGHMLPEDYYTMSLPQRGIQTKAIDSRGEKLANTIALSLNKAPDPHMWMAIFNVARDETNSLPEALKLATELSQSSNGEVGNKSITKNEAKRRIDQTIKNIISIVNRVKGDRRVGLYGSKILKEFTTRLKQLPGFIKHIGLIEGKPDSTRYFIQELEAIEKDWNRFYRRKLGELLTEKFPGNLEDELNREVDKFISDLTKVAAELKIFNTEAPDWRPGHMLPEDYYTMSLKGLRDIPRAILNHTKQKISNTYKKLEARYGRPLALAIISAGIAGLPIPLPGASAVTAAPVLVVAEAARQLGMVGHSPPANMGKDQTLTRSQIERLGKEVVQEIVKEVEHT